MKLRFCDLFHVILRCLPQFTYLELTQTFHCDHHWGAFQKLLYPSTSILTGYISKRRASPASPVSFFFLIQSSVILLINIIQVLQLAWHFILRKSPIICELCKLLQWSGGPHFSCNTCFIHACWSPGSSLNSSDAWRVSAQSLYQWHVPRWPLTC